ncbi:MAG TPA: glycoside hydrolase family 97 protein [Niabella sp.]|nr:glycoside hydrolase family 97 protein [Niabella sp.]
MKKYLVVVCLILVTSVLKAQTISSPDGKLQMKFELSDSIPYYTLSIDKREIIGKSKLGLSVANGESFLNGFGIRDHKISSFNENWHPVLGEHKTINNHYNELRVMLAQPKFQREIAITFRLFNEGLGFRYEFPQQANLNYFVVKEEESQFKLKGNHKAWWITGDYDTQEYSYTTSNISSIPSLWAKSFEQNASQTPVKNSVQAPLMMKSNEGFYINISEAALIGYPAMHLEVNAEKLSLKSHLTPDAQGMKGYIQTPFNTPWRTVVVTNTAAQMLEKGPQLILNLNEPTQYKTTNWIKPVKYIGVWWEMIMGKSTWAYADIDNVHLGKTNYTQLSPNGKHAANTAYVKKYIDFASKNGFDAVLVEGWNQGWEDWFGKSKEFVFDFVSPYPDFDVKELRNYAHQNGVKIIMHHETSASATNYERWMDTAFKFMNHYGYDAVKTGYVGNIIPRGEHHYSQWMIDHYQRVVEKAAEHQIMVNSHESVRPTGLNRTFPNWMASEAARGTEYEAFGGNNPEHTTILPFTRLMGGPMDYTPGIFQTKLDYYFPGDTRFVKSTLVKQLALYVTMYSPLQMAADMIENYERFPEPFQFIKDVPADWEDTKVLLAEPGDYILIARKAKERGGIYPSGEWFVGGITDENAQSLTIDFNFLDPSVSYIATIYEDGKDADYITNPQSFHIKKRIVTSRTKINQKLAKSGGVAISLKKAGKEDLKKYRKN